MTTQSIEEIISVKEQRFVLPGRQSWQRFKAIQTLMAEVPGVRVSYLGGCHPLSIHIDRASTTFSLLSRNAITVARPVGVSPAI